jgi:hypothetical protein
MYESASWMRARGGAACRMRLRTSVAMRVSLMVRSRAKRAGRERPRCGHGAPQGKVARTT